MGKIWALVVDDSEDHLILMERWLTKLGVGVHFAKDGLEAMENTGLMNVDVVFMDINMPVMDGVKASHNIKALRPELPIIGVTGEPLPLYIQADGSTHPFDELLAKPMSMSLVRQALYERDLLPVAALLVS